MSRTLCAPRPWSGYYLNKPFSATDLLARVRAVLRRAQPPSDVDSPFLHTRQFED